jgi:hypothetical protein
MLCEEKFSTDLLILSLGQSKQGWDHQSQQLPSKADASLLFFNFIFSATVGLGYVSFHFLF